MKIMQIMPEFGLAGAEIMCENLVYELTKLGHKVIVVSLYYYHSPITQRLEDAGIDIRYLNKKSGMDFSMFKKLTKLFRKEKPDVIHTHRYVMQYAIPAAVVAGIKGRVHTFHSIAQKENRGYARKINKIFFKYFGVVPVALSELVRDTIIEEYKIEKLKIPVIFNGVDLTRCKQKKEYSVDGNFKILHIGRFAEPKNHIGLIKAFHIFNNIHSDSELWLIGDGNKKAEIEEYVKLNDLISSVKFLGLKSEISSFLHDADIFTLPSNYEGIPMSLIEAMGSGLPIVATNVGGIPDMLTNEVDAIIVDNDINSIANAFEIYYNDMEMRETYGLKARERAIEFSSVTMAVHYESIYASKPNEKLDIDKYI